MWSTPSSIARRRTARAASGSRGGPEDAGAGELHRAEADAADGLVAEEGGRGHASSTALRRPPDKRGSILGLAPPPTRREELAEFLRHRRERTTPGERRPAGRRPPPHARACAARRSRSSPASGCPGTRGSSRAATSRRRRACSTRSRGCSTSTPAERAHLFDLAGVPTARRPARPVPGRGARRAARRSSSASRRTRPTCSARAPTCWPGTPRGDAHARRAVARAGRRAEPALVAVHRPRADTGRVGGHRPQHARPLPRRARAPLRRPALPRR